MNQIVTSKVIVGSTRNSLSLARVYGKLCLEELLLYEIISELINDCKLQKTANKTEELLTILNALQNKVDYICNIKDRHLEDYRAFPPNDYNVIVNTNQNPSVDSNSITIAAGDFTNNFSDPNGDSPNTVKLRSLLSSGILKFKGEEVTDSNFEFDVFEANQLIFELDNSSTTVTSFLFQVSDDNINKLFSNMATMNVVINDIINQPPSYIGTNALTLTYNSIYTFVLDDFIGNEDPGASVMFIDPEGDALESVRINTTPSLGTIKLNNIPVIVGTIISNADLVAGNLIYEADPGTTESYTSGFTFSASDDGSHTFTTGGVYTIAASAYINLPPDAVGDGEVEVNEGDVVTFTRAMFTTDTIPPYSDPENNIAHRLRLDTVPVTGDIKLDTVIQVAGDIVLFSDIDLGKLIYVQDAGAGGTTPIFTFSIADEGSDTFTS